jgi:predicted HTH transcriptional regulator
VTWRRSTNYLTRVFPTTNRSGCVFAVYYTVDGFLSEQVNLIDMSTRERDERGRFSAKHTDDEVLDAVQNHEPAGTSEIAEELGIKRPSADYRLRQLKNEDMVESKIIGNSLAWRLSSRVEA